MRKSFALALIFILAVSSLIIVKPSFASITKPSVPEFTLKLVDNSYDVPTTYSIDPYTGANVTHPSHRVDNKTIELTIKNQPYVPYVVQEGTSNWTAYFYYNVRVKGNFEENWINLYYLGEGPTQSNSDYTVLSYPLTLSPTQPDQGYILKTYDTNTDSYSSRLTGLPSNAQVDFQVEAMIGYVSRTVEFASGHFTGEASGWSNIQTITIDASTPTTTPNTTPSPTPQDTTLPPDQSGPQTSVLFGLDWIQVATLALLGVIAVLLVVVVVFLRRRSVK